MKREHSSFSEFLRFAANTPPAAEYCELWSRKTDYSTAKWAGTPDFNSAMDLARNGWADGREEIEKYRAIFSALVGEKIRRPVLSHEVHGFMPDVGAFCAGEPENMFCREHTDTDGPGKIIKVVANGSVSAGISPGSIIRRGALICALIDALEGAGYRCELIAGFHDLSGRISSIDIIPIKAAGDPLDLDNVAFAFAHPSMFRRMIFSAFEQDAEFMQVARYGYGMPTDLTESDRGDLYFGAVHLDDVSDADVVPWLKAKLEPLGITFED